MNGERRIEIMRYLHGERVTERADQKRNPKARAVREATMAVGTKAVASDVGLGAGASAAETLWTAETAIIAMAAAAKSFIFNASIFSVCVI